jgi:hypothetical protein
MKNFYNYIVEEADKPTINVDHDGLWVDFDRLFRQRFGMNPWDTNGDDDFWQVFLSNADKFFLECPCYEGYLEFFHDLEALANQFEYKVETLTALPRRIDYPDAEKEKRQAMVLHGLGRFKMKVGPYARDKWKHCRPGDILLDDTERNILEWRNAGGFAVHHNTRYGNNHTFQDTMDILRHHFYNGHHLDYLNNRKAA